MSSELERRTWALVLPLEVVFFKRFGRLGIVGVP